MTTFISSHLTRLQYLVVNTFQFWLQKEYVDKRQFKTVLMENVKYFVIISFFLLFGYCYFFKYLQTILFILSKLIHKWSTYLIKKLWWKKHTYIMIEKSNNPTHWSNHCSNEIVLYIKSSQYVPKNKINHLHLYLCTSVLMSIFSWFHSQISGVVENWIIGHFSLYLNNTIVYMYRCTHIQYINIAKVRFLFIHDINNLSLKWVSMLQILAKSGKYLYM